MFTVNLFVYHTRLVVNNVTTKEDNTKRFNTPFGNPYYKRNCWLNWCDVLFPTQNVYSILSILKWDNSVNSNSNSNNEVNTVISNNQQLTTKYNTSNVMYKNKITEEDNILKHSSIITTENIFNNEINKYIYEHTSETCCSVYDERYNNDGIIIQQQHETAAQIVNSLKVNNHNINTH